MGPKFIFPNIGFIGIKRRRIVFWMAKIFFPGITFSVHFATKVSLYFWNLRKNLGLLILFKPLHNTQYIVHDPKRHDLCYRVWLTQSTFFATCIFHAFTWGTTDTCLPFVKNVKKINRPTLLYSIPYKGRHCAYFFFLLLFCAFSSPMLTEKKR
jgi:hypothetical protein